MINIGYILTLDDGEKYVVCGKIKYKERTYYQLGNFKDINNAKRIKSRTINL